MDPKKIAAEKATSYIRSGMIVGLGTGSTALFAIEAIGKMVNQGLSIKAVGLLCSALEPTSRVVSTPVFGLSPR